MRARNESFVRGARLFDAGAFFEAHEAWEERWLVETDVEVRRFFQGLIQVAAGFHKLRVLGDRASASRLLAKGLAKLEGCADGIAGVSLGPFCEAVRGWSGALSVGESASSDAEEERPLPLLVLPPPE
jgi:predicted metal-dependent hydrolase